MQVTVYTTPNCVQCAATKRQFDKRGIVYDEMNLAQHPELVEQFKTLGLGSAPIVIAGTKTWSGFRLDSIAALERRLFSERKTV